VLQITSTATARLGHRTDGGNSFSTGLEDFNCITASEILRTFSELYFNHFTGQGMTHENNSAITQVRYAATGGGTFDAYALASLGGRHR
jgi:hypothetical protein